MWQLIDVVDSGNNKNINEKDRFWNELVQVVDAIGNGMAMGDMNGWIDNKVRGGATESFRVDGKNGKCERILDFCVGENVMIFYAK